MSRSSQAIGGSPGGIRRTQQAARRLFLRLSRNFGMKTGAYPGGAARYRFLAIRGLAACLATVTAFLASAILNSSLSAARRAMAFSDMSSGALGMNSPG